MELERTTKMVLLKLRTRVFLTELENYSFMPVITGQRLSNQYYDPLPHCWLPNIIMNCLWMRMKNLLLNNLVELKPRFIVRTFPLGAAQLLFLKLRINQVLFEPLSGNLAPALAYILVTLLHWQCCIGIEFTTESC